MFVCWCCFFFGGFLSCLKKRECFIWVKLQGFGSRETNLFPSSLYLSGLLPTGFFLSLSPLVACTSGSSALAVIYLTDCISLGSAINPVFALSRHFCFCIGLGLSHSLSLNWPTALLVGGQLQTPSVPCAGTSVYFGISTLDWGPPHSLSLTWPTALLVGGQLQTPSCPVQAPYFFLQFSHSLPLNWPTAVVGG